MVQPWSAWLPDVLPHVNGCPIVIAEHELRRAAQELFARSRAWSVLSAAQPVSAGTETLALVLPGADTELVRLEAAWYDSRRLQPTTLGALDDERGHTWVDEAGVPTHVAQLTPGVLRLYPVPSQDASEGVRVRASVRPAESATGVPDEIATRWREAIATGAKARLMLYPGKPWTNLDLGGALTMRFEQMIAEANVAANVRGHSNARRGARALWC